MKEERLFEYDMFITELKQLCYKYNVQFSLCNINGIIKPIIIDNETDDVYVYDDQPSELLC